MNTIEKINAQIQSVEWSIKIKEKEMEDYRSRIKNLIDDECLRNSASHIASYAQRLETVVAEIEHLYEQKRMLEYLIKRIERRDLK